MTTTTTTTRPLTITTTFEFCFNLPFSPELTVSPEKYGELLEQGFYKSTAFSVG